jgi:SAM-dependent methyltransferase
MMVRSPKRTFTRAGKYRSVAAVLSDQQEGGLVLDVGARDRILSGHLDPARFEYRSADMSAGHDYQINLEDPLPFDDRMFDVVVALDVLEHVDRVHQAFAELSRIAGRLLIVALPNLAAIGRRWSFLLRADLGTRKYDLLPDAQSDRHRWLTTYAQMNEFVAVNAERLEMRVVHRIEEIEGRRLAGSIGLWAAKAALVPDGFQVGRCIYVIERVDSRAA